MTSHYLDVQLRGDEETAVHEVLGVAFVRLHSVFARDRTLNIGISFPRYVSVGPHQPRHVLGDLMRLHGSERALHTALSAEWLRNLSDYVRVAGIAEAPPEASVVRWIRVQPKSSTERLVRRAMKRHELTEDLARERYEAHVPERVALPFIPMRSASTRRSFPLYVQPIPADGAKDGTFTAYGLSTRSGPTVPGF